MNGETEAIRPIWRNRILEPYNGSVLAHHDITRQTLPLLNAVKQEGTLHNAGRMNNLFDFHNLISMGGTKCAVTGWGTNRVVETITESEPDEEGVYRLIAQNVSEKDAGGTWTVTEELYDLNEFGQNVLVQKRVMTMKRNGSTWEVEIL